MENGYRRLRTGEPIEKTDEYISVFSCGNYIPVADCAVGKEILECNVKYYRRRIKNV
jgi:hypothetical protein